jgi:hypothetical protein
MIPARSRIKTRQTLDDGKPASDEMCAAVTRITGTGLKRRRV